MNNILVVNINWLGDAVFSTPVFKALKDNFPKSRISCLCVPRVKKVLEFCPFIDEIIVYDEKGAHFWPWQKLFFINELRRRAFDAAFLLHHSVTRGLLVYLAGIPQRIGYCKAKWLMTHPVVFQNENIHRADVYLKVLESYGLKIKDRSYELTLSSKDNKDINELLEAKGINPGEKFIVVHTAGNWDLKRWPASYFAQLIEYVQTKLNVQVILTGAQSDLEYCQMVNEQAQHQGIMLAGETTLGESLALYRRSQVVISSDSGPLHLAHSVGANVIGIFGPTRPEITGPRGIGKAQVFFTDVGCNKSPCYHLNCSNNVCMQAIMVNDVLEAIQKFTS
jgi:lipopolysaccharide heptosyltransferase II